MICFRLMVFVLGLPKFSISSGLNNTYIFIDFIKSVFKLRVRTCLNARLCVYVYVYTLFTSIFVYCLCVCLCMYLIINTHQTCLIHMMFCKRLSLLSEQYVYNYRGYELCNCILPSSYFIFALFNKQQQYC